MRIERRVALETFVDGAEIIVGALGRQIGIAAEIIGLGNDRAGVTLLPKQTEVGRDIDVAIVDRARADRGGGFTPAAEHGVVAEGFHAGLRHEFVEIRFALVKERVESRDAGLDRLGLRLFQCAQLRRRGIDHEPDVVVEDVVYDLSDWGLDLQGQIVGVAWVPLGIAGLVGAMLGHSFSCFTKFRGGKGVATGAGGFFMVMPVSALIAAVVWVLVFLISRYVSLASMISAATLPFSAWALGRPASAIIIASFIAAFVIFRHRANCSRLLNGTENRFVKKKPDGPVA